MEALLNRLSHFFHELFSRNIAWRRRRGEKWQPDLLNSSLQFAPPPGAFFDHARAPFLVQSTEIRRTRRRDQSSRPIWNAQAFQPGIKRQLLLFEKHDKFFH